MIVKSSHLNDPNKPVDQGLLRSSVILRKTFQFQHMGESEEQVNPDLDLFVNAEKSDVKKVIILFQLI